MSKKEEISEAKPKGFMSRNVTEFRHLMQNCYITEKDLDWVVNLRGSATVASHKSEEQGPPQVYFKKTKAFQLKTAKTDQQHSPKIIANQFDQIFLKSHGKSHHTKQQIQFYSSLRNSRSSGKMSNSFCEKSFSTIPFMDRKDKPRFIKKQYIKTVKGLTKKELQDGLDGAHKQEPYTQNILKTKNYGILESFTKIKGRNQVSLPSLAWQVGLRNYR